MGKNFKVHFLNTVWSDCMILERNGHYALIDTASKFYFPMIQEYLEEHNIKEFDFLLLTHFHSDHYGNIVNILNNYPVKKVYIKEYSSHEGTTGDGSISNEEYIKKELVNYHEILDTAKKVSKLYILEDFGKDNIAINFCGVDIEVYNIHNYINMIYNDETSPYYHQNRFGENFNSCCVFFTINSHNVLLGADMTNHKSEITLLSEHAMKSINQIYEKHHIDHIDLYKACHHGGSDNNATLISKLMPSYCVITNTAKWLDVWPTIPTIKQVKPDCEVLPSDKYQYIFDLSNKKINLTKIEKTSPFITLNKN